MSATPDKRRTPEEALRLIELRDYEHAFHCYFSGPAQTLWDEISRLRQVEAESKAELDFFRRQNAHLAACLKRSVEQIQVMGDAIAHLQGTTENRP